MLAYCLALLLACLFVFACLLAFWFVGLPACLLACLLACLACCCLFFYLFVCLFVCLSVCLFVCFVCLFCMPAPSGGYCRFNFWSQSSVSKHTKQSAMMWMKCLIQLYIKFGTSVLTLLCYRMQHLVAFSVQLVAISFVRALNINSNIIESMRGTLLEGHPSFSPRTGSRFLEGNLQIPERPAGLSRNAVSGKRTPRQESSSQEGSRPVPRSSRVPAVSFQLTN